MSFRSLRVINDDRVEPGQGFGAHPHEDMEIITYVVEGALEHKDSMGNGSIIRSGDVQRISAGRGVQHSEFNPSEIEKVHFLQIWIIPERKGLEPGYEQKRFSREDKLNQLRLIGSRNSRGGSLLINQDVDLYASLIEPGNQVYQEINHKRHIWVQVIDGEVNLNGIKLKAGDGAAISNTNSLRFDAVVTSELLVFDMA